MSMKLGNGGFKVWRWWRWLCAVGFTVVDWWGFRPYGWTAGSGWRDGVRVGVGLFHLHLYLDWYPKGHIYAVEIAEVAP